MTDPAEQISKPPKERVILHCDCNGFFASVECILDPTLKTVPMAVAGDPNNRHGIILAKNELAKKCGIQTAETVWQAKNKCPDLVLVAPHHDEYSKYSKLINQIYGNFTDLIEPFGIDESWLDVTGVQHLFGNGEQIADQIRAAVRTEIGLTISCGVSFNKIFAKLGSDYKKPDATTVISRENYRQIVFPLPVNALLFVGKSANETLKTLNIRTIGDLARSSKALLENKLGKRGEMLWQYANGLDDSAVRSAEDTPEVKSVGNSMTFKRDLVGLTDIRLGVDLLADEVAYRLRKADLKAATVAVLIKDSDFKSISRQKALSVPTHLAADIADNALELIKAGWNLKAPIRMLGVTASGLVNKDAVCEQLSLFDCTAGEDKEKQERLESTMDSIRDKYGKGAISKAGTLIDL